MGETMKLAPTQTGEDEGTDGKVTGPSNCNPRVDPKNGVKPAASGIKTTSEIKITSSDIRLSNSGEATNPGGNDSSLQIRDTSKQRTYYLGRHGYRIGSDRKNVNPNMGGGLQSFRHASSHSLQKSDRSGFSAQTS